MTKAAPPKKDQIHAFRKAARDLGCEPDEKRFQDALRTVAKAKPPEKLGKRHPKDQDA